jgi:hypothetical protein
LKLSQQYIELLLNAEGWNAKAYQYMQGPKGTKGIVTKKGWTKFYTTGLHAMLHQHPTLYLLAAELYQTPCLSFNYYDLKV